MTSANPEEPVAPPARIAVLGTGLIGTSIALAAARAAIDVTGWDADSAVAARAGSQPLRPQARERGRFAPGCGGRGSGRVPGQHDDDSDELRHRERGADHGLVFTEGHGRRHRHPDRTERASDPELPGDVVGRRCAPGTRGRAEVRWPGAEVRETAEMHAGACGCAVGFGWGSRDRGTEVSR